MFIGTETRNTLTFIICIVFLRLARIVLSIQKMPRRDYLHSQIILPSYHVDRLLPPKDLRFKKQLRKSLIFSLAFTCVKDFDQF